MPSPGPAEPSPRGAHRARRRPRRRTLATLAVGVGLAVTSVVTLVGGHHGRPAALQPVAVKTGAPAAAAAVPGRMPASASLGPLLKRTKPAAARLLHVRPVGVAIPAVGIDSTLVDLGLNPDRTLQAPVDYTRAGWYAGGSFPGDADSVPAIIAGHVDSWNGPAVFYPLAQVKVGQQVRVGRADGSIAVFEVYAAHRYAKDDFPADTVYAPTARSELRVITCTGTFDRDRRSYLDNLVLFARLNPAASQSAP
jgi:hypothetical protein